MAGIRSVRQVALAAGDDLDRTLTWWESALELPVHARFDPPGIAFILLGTVRLFFATTNAPATLYLDVTDLDAACAAVAQGDGEIGAPALVHVDETGRFGPAGEAEWMAFAKDPAGNTIGLVARRPHSG